MATNGVKAKAGDSPRAAPAPVSTGVIREPRQGSGTVVEVKSGDSIVISMGVRGDDMMLRSLTLAGVMAPRIGFKNATTANPDEYYAWASKEFLRKKILGKPVQFKVFEARGEGSGLREYAEVRFEGKNIAESIFQAGCAKFQGSKVVKQGYGDEKSAELTGFVSAAETNQLGMFGSGDAFGVRDILYLSDSNVEPYLNEMKGKELPCLVEHIRDAGSYTLCLLPGPNNKGIGKSKFIMIKAILSGMQAPGFRYEAKGVEKESSAGAFKARNWVSQRLMNKELTIRVEQVQKKTIDGKTTVESVIASLLHPVKGSIADFILEEGHAQYVDWSAALSISGPEKLKAAQTKAQDSKKGRWATHDKNSTLIDAGFEFNGKVIEILSGDQVKIINLDAQNRDEKRYFMASVRAPRRQDPDNAWIYATNEYFRKRLVGKTVKVRCEYVKNTSLFAGPAAAVKEVDTADAQASAAALIGQKGPAKAVPQGALPPASDPVTGDMYFVTVLDDKGENVCVKAIADGFLKVEESRGDADLNSKSRDYAMFLEAEDSAKSSGKGRWGGKDAPTPPKYNELVMSADDQKKLTSKEIMKKRKEIASRAESFLAQLKDKEHVGTVNHCINGTRFRIHLAHEKLHITFQMNGVRGPAAERFGPAPLSGAGAANMPKPEPFGNESLQVAREQVLQQDVKILIQRVDPAGTFQGAIYPLTKDGKGKKGDLAVEMLNKGLAYCDYYCENKAYQHAEDNAKTKKLMWWSIEHATEEVKEEGAVLPKELKFDGKISYINAIDDFYIITDNTKAGSISSMIEKNVNTKEFETVLEKNLQRRTIYLAQDWNDKKWYRAKYEGKGSEGASMFYIDTGCTAECEKLKKIPSGHPLSKDPPVAVKCGLYGVKTNDQTWSVAGEAFFKLTNNKPIVGLYEQLDKENNLFKVTMLVASNTKCVQEELLKLGVTRLRLKEKNPGGGIPYSAWKQAQDEAKRARKEMWTMGDPGDSEDEFY